MTKTIERRAGLIATHRGDGIKVLSGAGVGGGSLVIGMFMPQPRRCRVDQVYPAELRYDEMDSVYWPRARQNLGASPSRPTSRAGPQYKGARAWREYLAEFGKTPSPVPFAVDWDVDPRELAGTAPACHTVGEGPFGSNSGAKNSVDRNYLRWATATGNVHHHAAARGHRDPRGVRTGDFEVRCKQIDEYGDVLATKTFTCDYLFMAAGSVYTTSLLVTARARGWLPRLRAEVGKGFGNNGDFLIARLNLRKDVGSAQGGPGNVKFFDDTNPYAPGRDGLGVRAGADLAGAHHRAPGRQRGPRARRDPLRPATGAGKVYWPYGVIGDQGRQGRP